MAVIKLENGDVYEGGIAGGKQHGKGKYTYANGNVYEGDWVNGLMHGKGKFTFTHGGVYEGDLVNGNFHGKGKYTYANGEAYEGDFVNGNRHGKGKDTYANGDVYEGDFVDDKFHGKGKYIYASGKVEEGRWENGNFIAEEKAASRIPDFVRKAISDAPKDHLLGVGAANVRLEARAEGKAPPPEPVIDLDKAEAYSRAKAEISKWIADNGNNITIQDERFSVCGEGTDEKGNYWVIAGYKP